MIPSTARIAPRQSARKPPEPQYQAYSFPGPSLGWVSDQNLAMAQPGAAYMLENVFPTPTGGVLRRGNERTANLNTVEIVTGLTGTVDISESGSTVTGDGTLFEAELDAGAKIRIGSNDYTVDAIASDTSLTIEEEAAASEDDATISLVEYPASAVPRAMFSYISGNLSKLFTVTDSGVFDTSTSGLPTFEYALTSGQLSTAQYTSTDGTRYVRGVNGTDTPFVYDGSTFDTTPALTFKAPDDNLDPEILDFTWVFKNRFFFIEKDSLNAWYLPVGSIGGEMTRFSLGGELRLGGKLIYGGSWSIESGDGLNAYCVFATDAGEIAVYQGSDPGDANAWSKVGVYQIGRPKGPQAFAYRGGDLVIATDLGAIALSSALQKDQVTISDNALSKPIEEDWRDAVRERTSGPWSLDVWSAGQMVVVALPGLAGRPPIWFVANARTGRWARFTGWEATCLCVHGERLFFGSPDGMVREANVGGLDDGLPYTGIYVPVFDQLGQVGRKSLSMVRAVVRATSDPVVQCSVHADFRLNLPPPPDSNIPPTGSQWGSGKWGPGGSKWGESSERVLQDKWRNVWGDGEAIAIAHQVTSASVAPLDVEFIRTDALFTAGEMQA